MHLRQLDPDLARAAFFSCTLLFVGVVAMLRRRLGALGAWRFVPRAVVAVLAGGGSLVWWLVNGRVEGAVLVTLSPGHGVTEADLLVLPHLLVAVVVLSVGTRAAVHRRRAPLGDAGRPAA